MSIALDSYKVVFSDFLHGFLDYYSDAFGAFYPKWTEYEFTLVDHNECLCDKNELYEELSKHLSNYGVILVDKTFKIVGSDSQL